MTTNFWKHVNKNGPTAPGMRTCCWLWTGSTTKGGYGLTLDQKRTRLAHRVVWEENNEPIPDDLNVLHKCDTRSCVRRSHLFLGTHTDNMNDMYAKGRGPTGDKNGSRTQPHRRAYGDRNGSRTHPERRPRGEKHWTRRSPESRLCGEKNGRSKISNEHRKWICRFYRTGKYTQQEIATTFGISQTQVSRLIRKVLQPK
jgi:hypothetical protein